jgi:hypothetical protein
MGTDLRNVTENLQLRLITQKQLEKTHIFTPIGDISSKRPNGSGILKEYTDFQW